MMIAKKKKSASFAALAVLVSILLGMASSQEEEATTQSCTPGMTPISLDLPSSTTTDALATFKSVSTKRNGVYLDAYNQDYSRPYGASFTIEGAPRPDVSVSTTPPSFVAIDPNSFSYSPDENSTSLLNLNFLDNPEVSPAGNVGLLIQIPTGQDGSVPMFSEIHADGSYDDVHIRGDTGLFVGRSAKIDVTGYGAYVIIENIQNVTNGNWQLQVNCHDCRLQVINCDPVILVQDGGIVEISGGTNIAYGSKMYPKRGTLILRDGGIIEQSIKIDEPYFSGIKSNGCDEPGATITITEADGCRKVEWHEKDDRVACEEKEETDLDPMEMLGIGCTTSYCEDFCAFQSSTNNNINFQHSCSPTEACLNTVKDSDRADPEKEDNCGGSTSGGFTTCPSKSIWIVVIATFVSSALSMFI